MVRLIALSLFLKSAVVQRALRPLVFGLAASASLVEDISVQVHPKVLSVLQQAFPHL